MKMIITIVFLLFTIILLVNNVKAATLISGCTEVGNNILQCNGTITGNMINSTTKSL